MLVVVAACVLVWWGSRDGEHARADRERKGLTEAVPRRATSTASHPDAATDGPRGEPRSAPRDDPRQHGSCTLRLRVVDQATGRPVVSEVELWQLDVPATKHWTRGDRRVRKVAVGRAGATVERLPEGLYRAACEAQLRTDESPPAFVVRGDRTEVALPVRLPREFTVRLRVVDGTGRPVTTGVAVALRTLRVVGDESPPAWVVPGRRVGSPLSDEQETSLEEEEVQVLVEGDSYRLGKVREDHGSFRRTEDWTLRFLTRSGVSVTVDGTVRADRTYLGVTVPIDRILACIRLPGGGDLDGITIDPVCHAVEEAGVDWRDLRVDVTARLKGYERLSFRYRLAGPNEVRVLRPE